MNQNQHDKAHPMRGDHLIMTKAALTKDSGSGAVEMAVGGTVEGYAATFDHDVADSAGDVIRRGAFARTLGEWRSKGKPIPLLYGHNTDDPLHNIGRVVDAREDFRGLFVIAEFDGDNEFAQYARKLAQEGRLHTFSFAYGVRDQGAVTLADGTRANELRDLDLYEISLVQIPANQRAVVTDVKEHRKTDARELARLRREARELLKEIERDEALEYACAMLEAVDVLNS